MTRLLLKFIAITTLLCLFSIGAGVVAGQGRDSSRLLYTQDYDGYRQVFMFDTATRIAQRITNTPALHHTAQWSPDGRSIVYFSGNEFYIADEIGRNPRLLATDASNCAGPRCWSPDGTQLLLYTRLQPSERSSVALIDAATGEMRILPNLSYAIHPVLWSPDSRYIIAHPESAGIIVYELATGEIRLERSDLYIEDELTQWSPDGRHLLFRGGLPGEEEFYVGDIESGLSWNVSQNPDGYDCCAVWSPDRQRIAFVSELDGDLDIVVVDITGENRRVVYGAPSEARSPLWQTNSRLMFSSLTNAFDTQLRWADIDTNRGGIFAAGVYTPIQPMISPNRQMVVFGLFDGGLNVMTLAGETLWTVVYPHRNRPYHWQWSPDSRYIAYNAAGNTDYDATRHILSVDSGETYDLGDINVFEVPQWQPCCE